LQVVYYHNVIRRDSETAKKKSTPERLVALRHSAPDGLDLGLVEPIVEGSEGFWIGRIREGKAASFFQPGQVFEERLNDARGASVALGTPDADLAIGLLFNGYSDVAHIGS
jgi:hypothetical protein